MKKSQLKKLNRKKRRVKMVNLFQSGVGRGVQGLGGTKDNPRPRKEKRIDVSIKAKA